MLKRTFDILFASLVLASLSPVFIILAIIIKLTSPGPVFYRGKRVGRGGDIFLMFKFRSMVVNADKIGTDLAPRGDPRVTGVGKFLRKTKLDELPQLIDVLRGKMSVVGPRPESPLYVRYYNERQKRVLSVRPGIVGPAQIVYRHEDLILKDKKDPDDYYIHQLMPKKIEIDLTYIRNMNLLLDVKIIFRTLLAVLKISGKDQHEDPTIQENTL
jgi:lipopolysaccharide/colanic/teichoic acid biosynthesis glycosyltransferase